MKKLLLSAVIAMTSCGSPLSTEVEGPCFPPTDSTNPEENITQQSKFLLGVNLSKAETGLDIVGVSPDMPGHKAGMQTGDRMVRLNNVDVNSVPDLQQVLSGIKEFSLVSCVVMRDGREVLLEMPFGEAIPVLAVPLPDGAPHGRSDDYGKYKKGQGDEIEARQEAVHILLAQQKVNGRWPASLLPSDDSALGATVAVTAITSMALLENLEVAPDKIKKAIDRGLIFIDRWVYRKEVNPQDFEISQWGQIYALHLLNRLIAHPAWSDQLTPLKALRQDVFRAMCKRQKSSGGWGYSSSFQTAATNLLLDELKAAGFEVPKLIHEKSVAFLESIRHKGLLAYRYSLYSDDAKKFADQDKLYQDAAMRLALCSHAALNHGHQNKNDLKRSLKLAFEHLGMYEDLRKLKDEFDFKSCQYPFRRNDQTPYFFFHNFGHYHMALALSRLEADDEVKKMAQTLKDLIMAYRNGDGTWTCLEYVFPQNAAPENKVYATSMNLMTLRLLDSVMAK